MQATEKQVQMAAQLYDMRDKARRLLGDKYKPHMAELGKILKMTAEVVAESVSDLHEALDDVLYQFRLLDEMVPARRISGAGA